MTWFEQRPLMGTEHAPAWRRYGVWVRVLKILMMVGYMGLALLGVVALLELISPRTQLTRWLNLQKVEIEVSNVPRAQPLDISKTLGEIKKLLEGKGYGEARRLLKKRLAQEDWVAQTWVSFDFPQKLRVTLVPQYIWGYVFLTDQKRFFALTSQGDLLRTPVLKHRVAEVPTQAYVEGTTPDQPFLQRVQRDYDQVNEMVSRFGLSISQYALHPLKGASIHLSNGITIVQPYPWDESLLLRLEQAFHFLNKKISEINSIQFISSKKVVVSFRR